MPISYQTYRNLFTLFAFCAGAFFLSTSPGYSQNTSPTALNGLVLETLPLDSVLATSGLEVDDIMIRWDQAGLEQRSGGGLLSSPFDWFWLADEIAPRGAINLTILRKGELLHIYVPSGTLKAATRPILKGRDLVTYKLISDLKSKNLLTEAAKVSEQLALAQKKHGNEETVSWSHLLTGTIYERLQDFPQALSGYVKSLDSTKNPVTQVYIWQSIGIVYQSSGKLPEAECAYQNALAISEAAWNDSLIEATSLKALYLLAWKTRDLDRAWEYLRREAAILARHAPGSLRQASSWTMMGSLSTTVGDLGQAQEFHEKALALRKRIDPRSLEVAGSLINLGNISLIKEDFTSAKAFYYNAMDILHDRHPGTPEIASLYANLGRTESAQGYLEEAEKLFLSSLEEYRKNNNNDQANLAALFNSLSIIEQKRGDFPKAEDWAQQAINALQKIAPHSIEMANALSSLASIRYRMEDLERSRDLFEMSLSIRQEIAKNDFEIAPTIINIASTAHRSGNLNEAERLWQRALSIIEKETPDSLQAGRLLHNLAGVERERNNPRTALELLQRALDIGRRFSPYSEYTAMTLRSIGSTLRDLGRNEEALKYHLEAVEIAQEIPLTGSTKATILHEAGITLFRSSNTPEGIGLLQLAVNALETQELQVTATDESRTQIRNRFSTIYRDYIHALAKNGQATEAFQVQEKFLGMSFGLLLAERDLNLQGVSPELEATRRRLAASYDATQASLYRANQEGDQPLSLQLTKKLRAIKEEQSSLFSRLSQANPGLRALKYPTALRVEEAKSLLTPDSILLSFNVNKEGALLFAVTADGALQVHEINIGENELRRSISTFVGITKENPTTIRRSSILAHGTYLYDLLLGPVDQLISKSKRLLIIPDGPLHFLPFGALTRKVTMRELKNPGIELLVQRASLHIASSATVLNSIRSRNPIAISQEDKEATLAAFGEPLYGYSATPGTGLALADSYVRNASPHIPTAPLPWSREEVRRIAKLFPGHALQLVGEEASEINAKQILTKTDYRYIHFAGHAYADSLFPLNSAIVLSIPKESSATRENGLLQAWEIFEEARFSADLVVLSACESGLGKEMGGEGLIGLTRAFQYAGARSVMASLWKISDRTTAELMVRFYRHLKEGNPKDEALRAAQMELIRGPIQVTNEKGEVEEIDASAPYYWAAFQIYGDWQ